ncbi:MAG: DNA translocase FtsK, partial [Planctomycetota bacterium]
KKKAAAKKKAAKKKTPAKKKAAAKKATPKKKTAAEKKAEEAQLFDDEEEYEEDDYELEDELEDELEEDPDGIEVYAEDDADEEDDEEWEYEDEDEEDEYEDDPEAEYEEYDEDEEYEDDEEEDEYEDEEEEDDEVVLTPAKPDKKKAPIKVGKAIGQGGVFEPPTPPPGPWALPPLDLLEPPAKASGVDDSKLEDAARKLENALKSFRVEAEVVAAQVGPAVTMFELTIAQGTRMNKVTALSQEIAATLRAKSVRIIAPIPGKATVGIEVPNKQRRIVRMSELVTQKAYDKKAMPLPMFIGMDAEGNAIVEDLARMPHLLIAGTTGSGKSVCINSIIASLMLTRSPHDVQLILVDPKMVELQMFSTVPHLMLPVVTDARQATNVLLWAVEKMEGRYELFKDAGVKNIKGYNALGEDGLKERLKENFNEERTPRHVPYIVVVIDEMADLMMVSKKEAEQAITRLAQKSRAVGIHVIVATQRPSTDVITGVLKGNLPTRIAFQVASKIDSRVILDASGAEKLLGGGDMLYTPPQSSQLRRVQGALVEDHELQSLVDFVCQESAPNFSQELIQTATGTGQPGAGGESDGPDDPLWDDAVRVILKSRRGSASLLQRALGVGYTRASRLIDLMTQHGIVGEHKGSKAREILITLEDWEEMNGQTQAVEG